MGCQWRGRGFKSRPGQKLRVDFQLQLYASLARSAIYMYTVSQKKTVQNCFCQKFDEVLTESILHSFFWDTVYDEFTLNVHCQLEDEKASPAWEITFSPPPCAEAKKAKWMTLHRPTRHCVKNVLIVSEYYNDSLFDTSGKKFYTTTVFPS